MAALAWDWVSLPQKDPESGRVLELPKPAETTEAAVRAELEQFGELESERRCPRGHPLLPGDTRFTGSAEVPPQRVEFEDYGVVIAFAIEGGKLIKYVNGSRQAGCSDRSGVVTRLKYRAGRRGGGAGIRDQHGWGPDDLSPGAVRSLRRLAEAAGVPHNIPELYALTCDGCQKRPLQGRIHSCQACDFDLCPECAALGPIELSAEQGGEIFTRGGGYHPSGAYQRVKATFVRPDAARAAVTKLGRCGAILHQVDRTPEEKRQFDGGLSVMGNMYANPNVLVVQQTKLPNFSDHPTLDGKPRGPYERSGWCTFEREVAALMTASGGHVVELGVGRRPVRFGRHRSTEEMAGIFRDEEAVTFCGKADREIVIKLYNKLRREIKQVEDATAGGLAGSGIQNFRCCCCWWFWLLLYIWEAFLCLLTGPWRLFRVLFLGLSPQSLDVAARGGPAPAIDGHSSAPNLQRLRSSRPDNIRSSRDSFSARITRLGSSRRVAHAPAPAAADELLPAVADGGEWTTMSGRSGRIVPWSGRCDGCDEALHGTWYHQSGTDNDLCEVCYGMTTMSDDDEELPEEDAPPTTAAPGEQQWSSGERSAAPATAAEEP